LRVADLQDFPTGGRPFPAEAFRECLSGGLFHPQNGDAEHSVVRPQSHGGIEVKPFIPAAEAPGRDIRIRADCAGATRAGWVCIEQNGFLTITAQVRHIIEIADTLIAHQTDSRPDQIGEGGHPR
jgi:hypothetical protein